MALPTDDLTAPLGQSAPRKQRFRLPFTAPQAIAVVLGLFLLTFVGFALFGDNPFGGEPMARIAYDPASLPGGKPQAAPAAKQTALPAAAEPSAPKTITIIDGSSGQRREMPIGAGGDAPTDQVSSEPAIPLAGINQKLLENSRYGMIPIAADGLKPFRAYAAGSDLLRARAAAMPSVAIVVTGLGVGAAKTNDAIMKLPSAVTLAFTPYGSDPSKLVGQARAQKHEVVMQIPMEPFDYPDNDPGPQTLLTSLPADQNIDRLMWHMSRFQGYVGIANFMGSRFVVTDTALQPIIKEAARRGLGYLDDGSAPRSVAATLADAQAMPFAKADATIDAVPTAAEIDRTLTRLEGIAREHGVAIGVASALPVSIERIGIWARQLESRGIILVPLTTAMMKSKSS
jgi:polysaccharide deacetylase 2 family uncharacterized protein YibQ